MTRLLNWLCLLNFIALSVVPQLVPMTARAQETEPGEVSAFGILYRDHHDAKEYVAAHLDAYEEIILNAKRSDDDLQTKLREAHGHLTHALLIAAHVNGLFPSKLRWTEKIELVATALAGVGLSAVAGGVTSFFGVITYAIYGFGSETGTAIGASVTTLTAYLSLKSLWVTSESIKILLGLDAVDKLTPYIGKRLDKITKKLERRRERRIDFDGTPAFEAHEALRKSLTSITTAGKNLSRKVRCELILSGYFGD